MGKTIRRIMYLSLAITIAIIGVLIIRRGKKTLPLTEQETIPAEVSSKSALPNDRKKTPKNQAEKSSREKAIPQATAQEEQARQIDRIAAYIEEISFLYSEAMSDDTVSVKKLEKVLRRIRQVKRIAQSKQIEDLIDIQALNQIQENVATYINTIATNL